MRRSLVLFCIAFLYMSGKVGAGLMMNTDFQNTTGTVANDYHIRVQSKFAMLLNDAGSMLPHNGQPGAAFPTTTIHNYSPSDVTIDFSGATLQNLEWTHIGLSVLGRAPAITESWWTYNGQRIQPSGSLGGVLASAEISGDPSQWMVLQVKLYTGINGQLIGNMWFQDQGNQFTLSNWNNQNLYVTTSYKFVSTPYALVDLNEDLGRLGPESGFQVLVGVPEPSTLTALLAGGIVGIATCRRLPRRKDSNT
jgi:hypothetical protein